MISVNWVNVGFLQILLLILNVVGLQEPPTDGFLDSTCSIDPNAKKDCAAGHSLECKRSSDPGSPFKCQCLDGSIGLHDRTQPCLALVGRTCQIEVKTRPVLDCVSNAFCRNGTCDCRPGFDPAHSNQLCLIGYGSPLTCTKIDECNYNKGLDCRMVPGDQRGGACVCPVGHIWEPKANSCRAKIGSNCDDIRNKCVENAECSPTKKICTCGGDFRMVTETKECKKNYGKTCNITGTDEHDCHPNYQCLLTGEGHNVTLTCSCRPEVELYHNVSGGHCDKVAGQDCQADSTPCVPNAVCRFNKCVCSDGFERDDLGKCVLGHGGDCSWAADICSTKAKLICGADSKRCECQKGYEYQSHGKECRGLPTAPCESGSDCYTLAECGPDKKCQCLPGLTNNTVDGRCQWTHEQTCSIEKRCNEYDFLRCDHVTQKCICETPEMHYDTERKTCQVPVGKLCYIEPIDGRTLNCVRNAQCGRAESTASLLHGTCACSPGFEVTTLGFCDPKKSGSERLHVTSFLKIFILASCVHLKSVFF